MRSTPVIAISCSTLVQRGVTRFALANDYVRCVMDAGGLPLLLPSVDPASTAAYLARMDGLVLSGGYDIDPHHFDAEPQPKLGTVDAVRDDFELDLVKGAKEAGIPILAICRGIQIMNVAFGGTVIQDISTEVSGYLQHEQDATQRDALSHSIDIVDGTRLHAIAGAARTRVNSFHHQSVGDVADGFVVSARTTDGVVEGIEDPGHPFCVGVQWHPERRSHDGFTQGLFRHHVEAARVAARAGAGS